MLSASSMAALKTPSLSGATGLIRMPTGDILGSRDFNFGLEYYFDNSSASAATTVNDLNGTWSYKVNVGAWSNKTNGMELGFVGWTEKNTSQFKEGVFINMKYSLSSSEDPDALHLAIGIENLTSRSETDTYMVATKYWRSGAGLHFGAMFDFPNGKFRPLGMLGLGLPIGTPSFNLMSEVFAGESLFQLDAGLRYSFNSHFSLLVRALNLTDNAQAKDSKSFSMGFSAANFF
jgi:hypothetical protein